MSNLCSTLYCTTNEAADQFYLNKQKNMEINLFIHHDNLKHLTPAGKCQILCNFIIHNKMFHQKSLLVTLPFMVNVDLPVNAAYLFTFVIWLLSGVILYLYLRKLINPIHKEPFRSCLLNVGGGKLVGVSWQGNWQVGFLCSCDQMEQRHGVVSVGPPCGGV